MEESVETKRKREAETELDEQERLRRRQERLQQWKATMERSKEEPAKKAEVDDVDPLDAYMDAMEAAAERDQQRSSRVSAVPTDRGEEDDEADDDGAFSIPAEPADDFSLPPSERHRRRRELPQAEYVRQATWEPFPRQLYREVPALARQTEAETEQYRRDVLGDMKVHGRQVPAPVREFSQCGFSAAIFAVLRTYGYARPTPIQAQALPAILSGRDFIGCAKTGSGKTLAFLLPLMTHICAQKPRSSGDGPLAVVLAPTRELVVQIHVEAKRFARALGLRSVAVYGGADVSKQIGKLRAGCELVVATPGRMIDVLSANGGRLLPTQRVTFCVLDEADRMFDMGFEPQVQRIVQCIRPDRQLVLFSATFPKPVEDAARRLLVRPVLVVIGGRASVSSDVDQRVEVLAPSEKYARLVALLKEVPPRDSVLVFTDTQASVDVLYVELAREGLAALALHGGMDQADRDSILADFKRGRRRLLLATSVAARGLDVPNIRLVINYDCPNHLQDYIHRVGRTGRAGVRGAAVTLITPLEERYAPDLERALLQSNRERERLQLPLVEVPPALTALADAFREKLKAGTALSHGSGYGGKGFRFDESEVSALDAAKEKERLADLQEGGADLLSGDRLADIDEGPRPTAEVLESAPMSKGVSSLLSLVSGLDVRSTQVETVLGLIPPNCEKEAVLGLVQHWVARIQACADLSDAEKARRSTALTQGAEKVQTIDLEPFFRGSTKLMRCVLDINDYSPQTRWAVTHKDGLLEVREHSQASLNVRGVYVPLGKNPPPGQSRLSLVIESVSESEVRIARDLVWKLLCAESDTSSFSRPPTQPTGRYSLL